MSKKVMLNSKVVTKECVAMHKFFITLKRLYIPVP